MKNTVARACAWISLALLTNAPLAAAQTTEVIAGSRDFLNLPGPSVATYAQMMTVGPDGNLYLLEYAHNLVRYRSTDGTVTTMPGVSGLPPLDILTPYSVAFNAAGVPHILTYDGLFRLDQATGSMTLVAALPNPGIYTAFGADGTYYWQSSSDHRIRALLPSGEIRVIAGTGVAGYGGDGGPAELAVLNTPDGFALAPNGDLYVSDRGNARIRRIDAATGIITTYMGTGATTFTPDGLPAAQSNAVWPQGLAFDPAGNLLVVESGRVRRIDASTSIVTTVVGNGSWTFSGDGGPATAAGLSPRGLAVDAAGNIFVQDFGNYRIRRIAAATGVINTVVGNGQADYCGENVPARSACIGYVRGLDIEASGNVLISDEHGHRVRRISAATGNIVTVMNPVQIPGDPVASQIPVGIDHDPAGNIYVTTQTHRVWKLDSSGAPTFFAGTGQQGFSGDGGLAGVARLDTPFGVVFDATGNAFIADTLNNRVRRVDAVTRVITTYAGNGTNTVASGDGGPATSATVTFPQTLAIDPQGNLLIGETGGCIRRVNRTTRVITTLFNYFGVCVSTFPPGPLNPGVLGYASAMTFDRMGNLWFMYRGGLRRMDYTTNVITDVLPSGGGGFRAEGRMISSATAIEFDSLGRLYVSDKYNMRVFRISGLPNTTPDSTPPVITPNVNGPVGANGWYVGDVTVSFSVSDPESAITSQQGCGSTTLTQDTTGITITCSATSTGGASTGSVTIARDASPPVLEFGSATPAANANGWNGSDVSIDFTTSDATSGVASTSVPRPLAFTNEGAGMTKSVTVTDNAGNSATFTSPAIQIDKTPPLVLPSVSGPAGNNGWYVGDVQVDWSINEVPASIESSTGCAITSVTQDTASSTFTCSVTSAGGVTTRSTTVKKDSTPPTLAFGAFSPNPNPAGWYNADVSIAFSADDATSGVAAASHPSPLSISNEGVGLSRSVTVTDLAGNSATFQSPPINVDKTGPIVAPVVTGTLGGDGWYRSDVHVEWSINELPESITFINGCESGDVTSDTEGVMFGCVVNSQGGGIGMPQWIKRDTAAPAVQWGTFSPLANANGWNKTNITVPYTVSDVLSGVAGTSSGSVVISAEGAGVTGKVTVTDKAGNVATVDSPPRNIDKTPPVVTFISPANSATYGFYQDVVADYTCTDTSLLSCTAPALDGELVNTKTAGARTFKVTAKDAVSFTTAITHAFTVDALFNFGGFLAPASAPPTLNLVTRGALVPIRWQLPDGHGGFVTNLASFSSATVGTLTCGSAPVAPLNDTSGAPAGISFDAASNSFIYNWQTSSSWTGCRKLTIKLKDNSLHELRFKFQ